MKKKALFLPLLLLTMSACGTINSNTGKPMKPLAMPSGWPAYASTPVVNTGVLEYMRTN